MKKLKSCLIPLIITGLVVCLVLVLAPAAFCGMQSSSYAITTTVVSGGGGAMTSSSYNLQATIGQPTPLLDQADPPYSTTYDLYPGFWYTLSATSPVCADLAAFAAAFGSLDGDLNFNIFCDLNSDGDVDGSDLSEFIAGLEQD
jgi:hypothetical protein